MKQLLILLLILAIILVITLVFLVKTERQYDDCCFECNGLQTKIDRLEELSDYVLIFEQLLPPDVVAEWKAGNETIRQEKYKEYERVEQPIITKKEIGG